MSADLETLEQLVAASRGRTSRTLAESRAQMDAYLQPLPTGTTLEPVAANGVGGPLAEADAAMTRIGARVRGVLG